MKYRILKKFFDGCFKKYFASFVAQDNLNPVAFMGVEGQKLEMLFVTPEERGKGIGKKLVEYGIKNYSIYELTVNDQNPQAKGFTILYLKFIKGLMDEQGNPYPILYMKMQ